MSNADEFRAGTDPGRPDDYLGIKSIRVQSNTVDVIWSSKPDRDYRVEAADELRAQPPEWQPVSSFRTAPAAEDSERDSLPSSASNRFYRVKVR